MIKHPLGHRTTLVAVLVAGLLPVAGSSAAQDLSAASPAAVSVSSAGLEFWPEVEYGKAVLTVSGGGETHRYQFAAGESPFISVFNTTGELLPDGLYRWELDLVPEPGARRDLMIAATENGGEAPAARAPQSGAFAIVDGFIADPDLEEIGAGGPADEWAGIGSADARFLVPGGWPSDRCPNDSDEISRSATCEVDAPSGLENPGGALFSSGLGGAGRVGPGDTDSEVATGVAAEHMFEPSVEARGAAPPRRHFDPEGANGRPRSEEDQR